MIFFFFPSLFFSILCLISMYAVHFVFNCLVLYGVIIGFLGDYAAWRLEGRDPHTYLIPFSISYSIWQM